MSNNPSNTDSIDLKVLKLILENLVTCPEDLKIYRIIDEQGVVLSVVVNAKDMGIVIGRSGSMANTIKTIMRAIGKANNMNIRVQFLEPDGTIKYSVANKNEFKDENVKVASQSLDEDLKDFAVN